MKIFLEKLGMQKRLFFLTCFLMAGFFAYSQPSFLDSLRTRFAGYSTQVAQEKVFVHTDKNFYLTGETLWFKTYVVEGTTNKPSRLSKVAYIELLDDKNKPALRAMVQVQQGIGDGSFILPASFHSGNYGLRAYTAWMKNFDEAFFFQTPIEIVNTAKRPDWLSLEKKETYALTFYPEGGNFVDGIKTKVGFQIVNQYGKGIEGNGTIISGANDTVVRFKPLKFGIGNFDLTPHAGAVYKVTARLNNGEVVTATLPPVLAEGYVMQVTEINKEQLQITVSTNKTGIGQMVYWIAHTRQQIKSASVKFLSNGKAAWVVDKKALDDGVTSFTLFDAARQPVCERLYFKKPSQKLDIAVTTDAVTYEKRSKVSLSLSAYTLQAPVEGNLSLSVFLLDSLQGTDATTIENYLWLASELKGKIESPSFYFKNDNEETAVALDNLMLTYGWRRFLWEDMTTGQKPVFQFLPEYEGHLITGKIVDKRTGSPVPDMLCYLSVPAEKFYTGNAVSDQNGELTFVAKDVYGPVELIAQANNADSSYSIELFNPYSEKQSAGSVPQFSLPQKWKEQLASRYFNSQLANSFIPATSRLYFASQNDTTVFYGKPDKRYLLDEYTRFPTMEEVMREFIAEVRLQKEKDTFRYAVLNLPYRSHFDADPLVLFDGVPVYNMNKVIAFDPLKIRKIDVIARKYFWGNTINNGVVSYSTYDGNLANFELDPGAIVMEYNGLQVKREFYAPAYVTEAQVYSREPDRRNVLLWAPSIISGGQGKKEISFYTSDVPGTYAVSIQGISNSGIAGSRLITITVK